MRVGVVRIEAERLAVARLRFGEASEVVVDVAEIEVRLEEVGLEADRALVQRLRLGQLVAAVVNVGQVDQRGDERTDRARAPCDRRPPPRSPSCSSPSSSADAARKYSSASAVFRAARRRASAGLRPTAAGLRSLRAMILAGAASRRKSNVSCPSPRGQQRAHDAAKRRAAGELVVRLLDGREIGEREKRVGVGLQHRTDDAAFHEIPQVVFATATDSAPSDRAWRDTGASAPLARADLRAGRTRLPTGS